MLHDDLFEFAYVPSWPMQLDALARMAMPEPWTFVGPTEAQRRNYVLDRYLRAVFRKQALESRYATDPIEADRAFVLRKNCAVLNTGLVTPTYKPIYMYFQKVNRPGIVQEWTFKGFMEDTNKALLAVEHLPEKPTFQGHYSAMQFIPEWPIRLSYDRLLENENSLGRLPEWLQKVRVLPVYIESCVEMSRRDAEQSPYVAAHQFLSGQVQFVLPLYIGEEDRPDLAVSLSIGEGFYVAHTLVTLQMAYLSARIIARPACRWLLEQVT